MMDLTLNFLSLSTSLASCLTLDDQYNTLSKDGHIDDIFGLIATGETLPNIATNLGIPSDRLELILKRTPIGQAKLLSATINNVASQSFGELTVVASKESLSPGEAAAASHHRQMIDLAIRANDKFVQDINADKKSGIVVYNSTVVNNTAPPSTPPELVDMGDVIDATFSG